MNLVKKTCLSESNYKCKQEGKHIFLSSSKNTCKQETFLIPKKKKRVKDFHGVNQGSTARYDSELLIKTRYFPFNFSENLQSMFKKKTTFYPHFIYQGRSPGGRHGNPLQNSCLENPMDIGAWQATAHGVHRNCVRHSECT